MRATSLVVLLWCAVAGAQPAPGPSSPSGQAAAPSETDVDIAKAHFNTGQAYYEHGRFADAAREFEEAYRLSGRAPLLYNMGKAYDGGNDFARALDAYQRFMSAAPAGSSDRGFVEKRIELLQTLVGKIALDGATPGSAVTLDDKPAGTTPLPGPIMVNPGRHKLALAHEGFATFRTAVDVPVGGTATVAARQTENVKVVTVKEQSDVPVYKKWWLWTAVGGAVAVAGVVTAVVLTSGSSENGSPAVQLPQVR
jgi:hypothetical protein